MQVNSTILGYTINETGWGRLASKINRSDLTLEGKLLRECYDVVRAARMPPDDAYMEKAWQVTLRDLTDIYLLSDERQIPLLLLIFPFTFQFLDAEWQEAHQMLKEHAIEHGVDFIDFTEVFEALIFDAQGSESRPATAMSASACWPNMRVASTSTSISLRRGTASWPSTSSRTSANVA